MRRTVPLLVAALALLVASVLAVVLVGPPAAPERAAEGARAAAIPPVANAPILSPSAGPSAPSDTVRKDAAVAELDTTSTRETVGRALRGRVRVAGGERLVGPVLVFAAGPAAGSRTPAQLGRLLRGGPHAPTDAWALATTTADERGHFVLALPPDADTARIGAIHATAVTQEFARWEAGSDRTLELVLTPGATLVVEVRRAAGVEGSVSGLTVTVAEPSQFGQGSGRTRANGWTDDGGVARVHAAPAAAPLVVTVDVPDAACKPEDVSPLALGEERRVTVEITRGATIVGRLVDASGAGVQGKVTAHAAGPFGAPGRSLRSDTADDDGRFRLVGVTLDVRGLTTTKDGFLTGWHQTPSAGAEGETIDFGDIAMERGATITGRVHLRGGAPVPAQVHVSIDQASLASGAGMRAWRGARAEAVADEDGRFVASGLVEGARYDLESTFTDANGRRWAGRERGVRDNADVALELTATPLVRGVVLAPDGTSPVALARVHAVPTEAMAMMMSGRGAAREETRAGEDGRFELALPSGAGFTLTAIGGGHARSLPIRIGDEAEPEITVVLRAAAAVEGVVTAPDGTPVADATVSTVRSMEERIRDAWRDEGADASGVPTTKSGADGRFRLERLPLGEVMLEARHPDHVASEPVAVDVHARVPPTTVTLPLRRGGRIEGVLYERGVLAGAGRPIVVTTGAGMDARPTQTTDGGRFVVERLTPGSWQVVSMGGFDMSGGTDEESGDRAMSRFLESMSFSMVQVVEGGVHEVALGEPAKAPVRVGGIVHVRGEPLRRGTVSFVAAGGRSSGLRIATIGSDGRYETTLPSPGRYLITASDGTMGGPNAIGAQIELRREIPEVEAHELDLELPGGAIRGRVLGPDRRPAAGTIVSWTSEEGTVAGGFLGGGMGSARTDDDGRYELARVPPGKYRVAAGGSLFAMLGDSTSGRTVRSGIVLTENEVLENVDFQLSAPGELRGTVRDAAGRPVPGATVFVRDDAGALVDMFSFVASDEVGAFTWKGLAPGRYSAHARVGSTVSPESATVTVRSNETANVEVVLSEGATLVVRLEDADAGDGFVRVAVRDESGRQVGGTFAMEDLAGLFGGDRDPDDHRFGPLAPGRYHVTATDISGRKVARHVDLSPGQERRLRLRFRD